MFPENPPFKLYVLVRQDLNPGYQIAQSIHAKDQFTHIFPSIERKWYFESNTIVVLGVRNEQELNAFSFLAKENGLAYSLFFEPDINENTALAIEPGEITTEIVQNLRPAIRGYKHIIE